MGSRVGLLVWQCQNSDGVEILRKIWGHFRKVEILSPTANHPSEFVIAIVFILVVIILYKSALSIINL